MRRVDLASTGQLATGYLSLAAVVIIPLYFNTWADRSFDQQKNLLLIAIATLICAAMVTSAVACKDYRARLWALTNRIEVRVLFLVLATQIVSSVLSITPQLSWLGSYDRTQGTLTILSGAIVCIAFASEPRGLPSIHKLAQIVTLTSVPVAGYALLQHWGLDPLPWRDNVELRVTSHMGNPVQLGAWLMLAIPFSTGLLLSSRDVPGRTAKAAVLAVLLMQVIALYWTYSRGPFLGLISAAGIAALAWLIQQHGKGKLGQALGLVALCSVFGIGLLASQMGSLLDRSRPPVNSSTTINSPADLSAAKANWVDLPNYATTLDPSSQARLLIWQNAATALAGDLPLRHGTDPDKTEYGRSPLRLLFGFGPETSSLVLNQFRSVDWVRVENPALAADRAHNLIWDNLLTLGAIGAVAQHLLYFMLFSALVQALGFSRKKRQRLCVFLSWWLAGFACAVIAFVTNNAALAPPLLVAGSLLGGGIALLLQQHKLCDGPGENTKDRLFALVLLAALVAHLVEAQFGVGGAASQLYFFVLAGSAIRLTHIKVALIATADLAGNSPVASVASTSTQTLDNIHSRALIAASIMVLTLCYLPPSRLQLLGVTGEGLVTGLYAALLIMALLLGFTGYRAGAEQSSTPTHGFAHPLLSTALLTLACAFIWNFPLAQARANTLYHSSLASSSGVSVAVNAKQSIARATALSPAQPTYLVALAQKTLRNLPETTINSSKQTFDTVFEPLQRALDLHPWSATFVANKARAHIVISNRPNDLEQRNHHLQRAIELQQRAVVMHRHDASLLNTLVSAQFEFNANCELAITNLQHSETLQPKLSQTQRLLADVALVCLAKHSARYGQMLVQALEKQTQLSRSDSAKSAQISRWTGAAQSLQEYQQYKLALQCLNAALSLKMTSTVRWQLNVRKVDSLRLNNKASQAAALAKTLTTNTPEDAPAAMQDFLYEVLSEPLMSPADR